MFKRIVIAGALFGLLRKRNRINLRQGTLAIEDFYYHVDSYMKEHGIEWSDLDCTSPELLSLYINHKDDRINELFKAVNPDLPDLIPQ